MKSYLSISFWSIVSIFFVGSAQAVVAPYYAHGDVSALKGDLSVIERDSQVSTGALSVSGGSKWWCEVSNPTCGIVVNPGASSAWGEVSVNPVTGTLGARAGSLRYGNNGGYGEAYGYMSQVFSVGTDGTLLPGDSVSVDANMLLQGIIESQSILGSVAGMVLLNHYDSAYKYRNFDGTLVDHMPLSTFQDIFFSPTDLFPLLLGSVQHSAFLPTSLVNFSGSTSVNVNVGDVLIMETMLFVENHLGYSDNLGESWTDFQNTLTSALTTTTPGATLNAVPVPAAAWLFGSGLIGLIGVARRKKA